MDCARRIFNESKEHQIISEKNSKTHALKIKEKKLTEKFLCLKHKSLAGERACSTKSGGMRSATYHNHLECLVKAYNFNQKYTCVDQPRSLASYIDDAAAVAINLIDPSCLLYLLSLDSDLVFRWLVPAAIIGSTTCFKVLFIYRGTIAQNTLEQIMTHLIDNSRLDAIKFVYSIGFRMNYYKHLELILHTDSIQFYKFFYHHHPNIDWKSAYILYCRQTLYYALSHPKQTLSAHVASRYGSNRKRIVLAFINAIPKTRECDIIKMLEEKFDMYSGCIQPIKQKIGMFTHMHC
jgi:hypothetical protein